MRRRSRKWRWLGLVAALLVAGFFAVRTWVVPTLIVRLIQDKYHGKVVVGNWWLGWNSSGLDRIELHETPSDDSPAWFSADKISTDVSVASLLRGRFMPTRIEIDEPKVDFHLDAKGQPITKIPIGEPGAKPEPIVLPEIVIKNGEITLAQDGRKPMTIGGVDARLAPGKDGPDIDVKTDDPTWGQVTVKGHLSPTFKDGVFEIDSSPGFVADPKKLEAIPFVPAEVWANLEPRGPVDAKVKITLAADSPKPVTVHTELTLRGTAAKLNSLQVEATDTTGHVVIDDALVRIDDLKGKTLDGSIAANGTLNFGNKVPTFDLDLVLKGIDATKTPKSWQLGEVDATGKLSGRVNLKVALDPAGPDLTGTAGAAVIEDGSFQGIPVKSLSLGLRADGGDLQYETLPEGTVNKDHLDHLELPKAIAGAKPAPDRGPRSAQIGLPDAVLAALPILDLASHSQGLFGWIAFGVKEAITLQVKHAEDSRKGGLRLPKTISTKIELEDVDLQTLVEKAKKFGIVLPFPVAGRFSIKADATIPLGALGDIKAYAFKGDATLRAASIDHVDLGLVTAHLEFLGGRLDLTDFRGQFVDRPTGNVANPPAPSGDVPSKGPLPRGAFRGNIHAAIDPRGAASAHFEGEQLPLGEVFAPLLPHPSPLSGEATLLVDASADLGTIADPKTWSLSGHVDSRRIKYLDAALDQIAARFEVKDGRANLPEFAARLLGKPLKASGGIDLAPPYRYNGGITIEGWEVAEVLKFVPGVPSPPPASGVLDAKGDASGTLQPFDITTKGDAKLVGARVGPAPVGNLGFHWTTDAETIAITGLELLAFGGKTTGEARIPIKPGQPVRATANLEGIDAGRLGAAFLGKDPTLAGRANGRVELTMPLDASRIDGQVTIRSAELTVRQGLGASVAVKTILVNAVARDRQVAYEATAEGLGGKFRFHGSVPVGGELAKSVAEGEILAVGFRLGEAFRAMGLAGGAANLDGLGAFDANIRAPLKPFQLAARGQFELRDLRYGHLPPFGNLKGIASVWPHAWRLDGLQGDLMGGLATGEAHGDTFADGSKQIGFDVRIDRASLPRLARLAPSLARDVEGYATLRVAGTISEAIRANAEILVPRSRFHGVAITDLRLPVELEMNPANGDGSVHSRHWTARIAGGSVRGNAYNRFGHDHSFQTELQLTGVDLQAVSKFQPPGKKALDGKVSGKITLNGPNAEHVDKIRGRIDLDLDDASLIDVPMFRELDKFLGSSGGGLFEDGDIHGTIYNKTLFIEQMTLTGRLIQVHATGAITMNGALNLEILVNTNAHLSQPELAILNVVPGLGRALGEGEEAVRRVVGVLENSLLKFRVSGTTGNPHVQLDPGIAIGSAAVGFFTSVVKVPGR